MIDDITSAATGIMTNVVSLLSPVAPGSEGGVAGYNYLLALVAFAAAFAISRRVLKKVR